MFLITIQVSKKIAIIYPNKSSSSETFIKAHVDNLPCEKKILYGGWFPQYIEGDQLLITGSISLLDKIRVKINNRILKRKNKQSLNQFHRTRALRRYFIENKVDAVLAEYGPTGASVMSACEEANIPLIVHFHGFDAYHLETLSKFKKQYVSMFKKARAIIAVSNDMKKTLELLGAPAEKVFYNIYGIDATKFTPPCVPVKEPIFFFVGRFVNKKAPHLLILAFAKVQEMIPAAKLIMGGDGGLGGSGELYSGCKQMVLAMRLTGSVKFLGSLTPIQVATALQNAYVYVQHSVRPDDGDSEGTPNAILEASATGLPVVATRHAGINDVVIDNETGYLVDEYDVDEMARKMIHLVNEPTLAYKMGQAGRRNILDNYTIDKSIANLWSIIENAVSKNDVK